MFAVVVELSMIYGFSPVPLQISSSSSATTTPDAQRVITTIHNNALRPPLVEIISPPEEPVEKKKQEEEKGGDVDPPPVEKHGPPPLCQWDSPNPFASFPSSSSAPDLLFVISTVYRKVDYFTNVLKSIDAGLHSSKQYNLNVKIVVINNLPPNAPADHPEHAVFHREKLARANDARFDFIETVNLIPDPGDYDPSANQEPNPELKAKQNRQEHPNIRERKHTRDAANSLRVVSDKYASPPPRFVIMQEDDFVWCPRTLFALAYLGFRLDHQHSAAGWLSARFSIGTNGLMLHGGRDVIALSDYLVEHCSRRPSDHMMIEWFAGESTQSAKYKAGRPHAAYRYVLFEHTGTQSSVREAHQPAYSSCWAPLKVPEIFVVEAYDPTCSVANNREDIWPCVFPANNTAAAQCPPWGGYNKV